MLVTRNEMGKTILHLGTIFEITRDKLLQILVITKIVKSRLFKKSQASLSFTNRARSSKINSIELSRSIDRSVGKRGYTRTGRTGSSGLKMVSEVEANGITIKNASLCPESIGGGH